MRMCHIISLFVVCVTEPIFFTLSHKRDDFREKFTEHKMCFDFLCVFVWNMCHFNEEMSEILCECSYLCKESVTVVNFNKAGIFSTSSAKKNTQISI